MTNPLTKWNRICVPNRRATGKKCSFNNNNNNKMYTQNVEKKPLWTEWFGWCQRAVVVLLHAYNNNILTGWLAGWLVGCCRFAVCCCSFKCSQARSQSNTIELYGIAIVHQTDGSNEHQNNFWTFTITVEIRMHTVKVLYVFVIYYKFGVRIF